MQVNPDGKYVVDVDKSIDITKVDIGDIITNPSQLTPNTRVALRNDSYTLHKVLPNKVWNEKPFVHVSPISVDPLVSLMMVEKVPDSTYEMVGGLDKQIKEIKEVWQLAACSYAQVIELPVKHPELFEALGIAQPKVPD